MGEKDVCIGDEEFKFVSPSKDLSIHTLVNCGSHWVCSEREKTNSPSLSKASPIINVKNKQLLEMEENHLGQYIFSES